MYNSRITVAEYAWRWLARRMPNLKPSTRLRYCDHVRVICEGLGHLRMAKLAPGEVADWLADLGTRCSKWTVNGVLRVLRVMTRDAKADLRLVHWACERVSGPRLEGRYSEEQPNALSEHDQPIAPNVLGRDFTASAPNQRWVGDTTELRTFTGGKFYLAAIIDLYARFCVGWAVSASNDRRLTVRALEMAIRRRCPETGLLHHSDQGSTYASEDYQDLLATNGIACSMSRRGNCLDNAAMESWFSTVKFELGEDFESMHAAKEQLFDYIEVFYNQQRRHSSIDYVSPARYERERRADVQLAA
jgi:transposase InsO family protein